MKKFNAIVTLLSLLGLASCGSETSSVTPISTSSTQATSSLDSKTYTFEEQGFYVVGDYSGSKIQYKKAIAEKGDYPEITDLTDIASATTILGYSTVRVGSGVIFTGTYGHDGSKYYDASGSCLTNTKSCGGKKFIYSKSDNKLSFANKEESSSELYDSFMDASHFKYYIESDGTIKNMTDLEDNTTVEISFPLQWLTNDFNKVSYTVNYDFVGVYLA